MSQFHHAAVRGCSPGPLVCSRSESGDGHRTTTLEWAGGGSRVMCAYVFGHDRDEAREIRSCVRLASGVRPLTAAGSRRHPARLAQRMSAMKSTIPATISTAMTLLGMACCSTISPLSITAPIVSSQAALFDDADTNRAESARGGDVFPISRGSPGICRCLRDEAPRTRTSKRAHRSRTPAVVQWERRPGVGRAIRSGGNGTPDCVCSWDGKTAKARFSSRTSQQ